MTFFSLLQLITAGALIVLILLQERSAGASGIFGGGGEGGFYQTRRGFEKAIFLSTLGFLAALITLSLLNLLH